MKGLLLTKKGMTRLFDKQGNIVPVTVLQAEEANAVISYRLKDKDGYEAIQIGYLDKNKKKLNKPEQGHYKASQKNVKRFLKEIKSIAPQNIPLGSELDLSIFSEGEKVKISGQSIGKGYQGTIKRHGFTRGPISHGSKSHRIPGSIGGNTFPARVFKGQKMAGQMGNVQITTSWMEIVKIESEDQLVFVKGTVPGSKESIVFMYNSAEMKLEPKAEQAAPAEASQAEVKSDEQAEKVVKEDVSAESAKKEEAASEEKIEKKMAELKKVKVPEIIEKAKSNTGLVHQSIVSFLASARIGSANTKTRSQVAATGAKMYAQKGLGRARHGDATAPHFRKGATAFGPKPRDYSQKLPKKMARVALATVLQSKKDNLFLLEENHLGIQKTKEAFQQLCSGKSTLFVLDAKQPLNRAVRNIKNVQVLNSWQVQPYHLLWADSVCFQGSEWENLVKRASNA